MVIYLDNAATTPLSDEIISFMNEANKNYFGNPSSLHSLGRQSKKLLSQARERIAAKINAESDEIIFVSGATEANNTVFAIADYELIISSPSEHPSVLEPVKASLKQVLWLNLDEEGFVNLSELESHLKNNAGKKVLVSIMHGNNEIGTVQDIAKIGGLCKQYGAIFHSDCVQTFCKFDIDVKKLSLDFISVSAHKLHGPKGVGFLYKNRSLCLPQTHALIKGGGQEGDCRSGTENLISILAMAELASVPDEENQENLAHINKLQKYLTSELNEIEGCILNGPKDLNKRVPGIINISLTKSNLSSEQLVLRLDLKQICVSSGSACSSNKDMPDSKVGESSIVPSYVLRACRIVEPIAAKAIRLSISRLNIMKELEQTVLVLRDI